MGTSLAGKAVSVTNAFVDGDGLMRGSSMATICGGAPSGGTCVVPGTNNTNHLWVFTQNQANSTGESHSFYVTVIG